MRNVDKTIESELFKLINQAFKNGIEEFFLKEMKLDQEVTALDEYLTIDEVCLELKVSRQTLYNWRKSKILPAKKLGREWRYARSQIDEFMKIDSS